MWGIYHGIPHFQVHPNIIWLVRYIIKTIILHHHKPYYSVPITKDMSHPFSVKSHFFHGNSHFFVRIFGSITKSQCFMFLSHKNTQLFMDVYGFYMVSIPQKDPKNCCQIHFGSSVRRLQGKRCWGLANGRQVCCRGARTGCGKAIGESPWRENGMVYGSEWLDNG
jgi:hypothetical protein